MKLKLLMLVVTVGVIASTGCSTIADRKGGYWKCGHHDGIYPGLRTWPSYTEERLTRPSNDWDLLSGHFGLLALPFVAADLGLSFGIDTVMFPSDGIYFLTHRKEKR